MEKMMADTKGMMMHGLHWAEMPTDMMGGGMMEEHAHDDGRGMANAPELEKGARRDGDPRLRLIRININRRL